MHVVVVVLWDRPPRGGGARGQVVALSRSLAAAQAPSRHRELRQLHCAVQVSENGCNLQVCWEPATGGRRLILIPYQGNCAGSSSRQSNYGCAYGPCGCVLACPVRASRCIVAKYNHAPPRGAPLMAIAIYCGHPGTTLAAIVASPCPQSSAHASIQLQHN